MKEKNIDCLQAAIDRLPSHRLRFREGRLMIYAVTGRLRDERQAEFHQKLTDGTIAAQRPDGMEIVASMRRARVAGDGMARWTELCYCSPPLRHERETVLDRYFTGIETEPVGAHARFEGTPLIDILESSANAGD